jgi:hypothetical protein
MNADEYKCIMPLMHRSHSPFWLAANIDSALNIRVYLRSSTANCFFQDYPLLNTMDVQPAPG